MKNLKRLGAVASAATLVVLIPASAHAASGSLSHSGHTRSSFTYTKGTLKLKLTDKYADGKSANISYISDKICAQAKNSNGAGTTTTVTLNASKGSKIILTLGYGEGYNMVAYKNFTFTS